VKIKPSETQAQRGIQAEVI